MDANRVRYLGTVLIPHICGQGGLKPAWLSHSSMSRPLDFGKNWGYGTRNGTKTGPGSASSGDRSPGSTESIYGASQETCQANGLQTAPGDRQRARGPKGPGRPRAEDTRKGRVREVESLTPMSNPSNRKVKTWPSKIENLKWVYWVGRVRSTIHTAFGRLGYPALLEVTRSAEAVLMEVGMPLDPKMELDHRYPVAAFKYLLETYGRLTKAELDLMNSGANLQWLTRRENRTKQGQFDPEEFETYLLYLSE